VQLVLAAYFTLIHKCICSLMCNKKNKYW